MCLVLVWFCVVWFWFVVVCFVNAVYFVDLTLIFCLVEVFVLSCFTLVWFGVFVLFRSRRLPEPWLMCLFSFGFVWLFWLVWLMCLFCFIIVLVLFGFGLICCFCLFRLG